MSRLLYDRYFAIDDRRACDLVTGEEVNVSDVPRGMSSTRAPAALLEVLDHGRDGEPRRVECEAGTAARASLLARAAAVAGTARGYVCVAVDLYLRFGELLADDLTDRTLLLIATTRSPSARVALLRASAASPRPHVLLAMRTRQPVLPLMAREARAAYGSSWRARPAAMPPEVARYLQDVGRAAAAARDGRHAAAERLLRESAAALGRRLAHGPRVAVLLALGRLLLERGRAADADRQFEEAARCAAVAHNDIEMVSARVWQAAARYDAGRLSEAESICRAALLTSSATTDPVAIWARAQLCRVLVAQERRELDEPAVPALDDEARAELGPVTSALIDDAAVQAALACGSVFEAGQRVRAALDAAAAADDPLARAIAATAHLRLLAATGDLGAASEAFGRVCVAARAAHAPLRIACARVIWHDALRRAGRRRDADRQLRTLTRVAAAAPPRLRQTIAARSGGAPAPDAGGETHAPTFGVIAVALVRVAHEEDDDARAVRRVVEALARELRPTRLDLVSCDAGPVTTLLSLGSGLPTRLGSRVLDAGIVIGPEGQDGGQEIGVPVRVGQELIGGLVARWPADRLPPAYAADVLQIGAAVVAPRLEQQLAASRAVAAAATTVPELVGPSEAMSVVRRAIARAAGAPFTVLIEGESGVGKELVARAIHQMSARRERRFCDVNCAAIPDDLLDAELFGHARGAFTGAIADRAGLFEEADGGTLFLDEVADLSPRGQAKLLRVLQQHEVRRVGESFSRKIDVRLVAAANRDMRAEAAAGRFRQDLLYRLDVLRIHIPPLRERPADVAVLAEHFWRAAAGRVASTARLSHGALAALTRYHWPGNVRELQNVMAALAVAASSRGRVPASLLPAAITGVSAVRTMRLAEAREQFERRCVEVALAQAGGNRTRAAAQLGLSRQGLLKTMVRLGIEATTAACIIPPARCAEETP